MAKVRTNYFSIKMVDITHNWSILKSYEYINSRRTRGVQQFKKAIIILKQSDSNSSQLLYTNSSKHPRRYQANYSKKLPNKVCVILNERSWIPAFAGMTRSSNSARPDMPEPRLGKCVVVGRQSINRIGIMS